MSVLSMNSLEMRKVQIVLDKMCAKTHSSETSKQLVHH